MKTWRCTVCGYIHQGDEPPEKCPNCNAPKEKFVEEAANFEEIHMHYGQKLSYSGQVDVNPFFGDYEHLAPFMYNLPVGQAGPLHKHPTTDEIFYIIKGKVQYRVGEKHFVATPGDLVQVKKDTPHKFTNIGDEPAAFLSVKGPKPVDLELLEEG